MARGRNRGERVLLVVKPEQRERPQYALRRASKLDRSVDGDGPIGAGIGDGG